MNRETMKHYGGILLAVLALLAAACTGNDGVQREPQPTDTLYTAEKAMTLYGNDPDRALVIIDSALIVGNVDSNLATLLRAKVYCQSTLSQRLDTALLMLESLMESDFVKDTNSCKVVLDLLVNTTRLLDNSEQCLRWATMKADICRQQGEETEALRTEAEIGLLLVELSEEEKGLAKLNGVISSLDGQRHVNEMDACIIALKRKINVLQSLDREAEVIPLAQHIVEILNDYRQHPDEYDNNSYRMTTDKKHCEQYCDFYSAQAYGYLAQAYAKQGNVLLSRHYLHLFEQSDYGKSLGGRKAIAPTWCRLGDYNKMFATYDELLTQIGDDTVSSDYLDILRNSAIAAEVRGDLHAALDYQKRLNSLSQKLNRKTHQSQIHEYAVRYHLQEERLNTEREQAAKKRIGLIAIGLIAIALTAVTFLVLLTYRMHAIRKKNAALTKEITDKIAYEEKYRLLVDQLHDEQSLIRKGEAGRHLNASTLATLSDSELFDYLRHVILSEKLHLNPIFDRQQLMDRLHLSKDRIGAAFSQGSEYHSLKNFLTEMRLHHSTKLLAKHPGMTISEVASASGFSSAVVFTRNFKQRFAITPSEFREKKTSSFRIEKDD